jgi:hypothetical protein
MRIGLRDLFRLEKGQEVARIGQFVGDVHFTSAIVIRHGVALQIITWPAPGVLPLKGEHRQHE